MTRVKSSITLFAGLLLLLFLIIARPADKNTSAKENQLSGTVHSIDQDTSSIIVRKGKVRNFRGRRGVLSDVKKAIVTLEEGHRIDVTTGL